jgi:hypothetical protein
MFLKGSNCHVHRIPPFRGGEALPTYVGEPNQRISTFLRKEESLGFYRSLTATPKSFMISNGLINSRCLLVVLRTIFRLGA